MQPFAGDEHDEDVQPAQPAQPEPAQPQQDDVSKLEDIEPIEYEDDGDPEELKRQKTCEAPTQAQRREHIESKHTVNRGLWYVCIKARATGTPHAIIQPK